MNVQIITTPAGEELSVMPKREYDALVRAAEEAMEDAADVAAFDAAMADLAGSSPLPAEVSANVLKGMGLLRAIRTWKGKQQQEVAAAAGLSQGSCRTSRTGNAPLPTMCAPALHQLSMCRPHGSDPFQHLAQCSG